MKGGNKKELKNHKEAWLNATKGYPDTPEDEVNGNHGSATGADPPGSEAGSGENVAIEHEGEEGTVEDKPAGDALNPQNGSDKNEGMEDILDDNGSSLHIEKTPGKYQDRKTAWIQGNEAMRPVQEPITTIPKERSNDEQPNTAKEEERDSEPKRSTHQHNKLFSEVDTASNSNQSEGETKMAKTRSSMAIKGLQGVDDGSTRKDKDDEIVPTSPKRQSQISPKIANQSVVSDKQNSNKRKLVDTYELLDDNEKSEDEVVEKSKQAIDEKGGDEEGDNQVVEKTQKPRRKKTKVSTNNKKEDKTDGANDQDREMEKAKAKGKEQIRKFLQNPQKGKITHDICRHIRDNADHLPEAGVISRVLALHVLTTSGGNTDDGIKTVAPKYLHCGCPKDASLFDLYLWGSIYAKDIGGNQIESFQGKYLTPCIRYFLYNALWAFGMTIDDL
ncbi:hypothetical protein SERLA73DRAFT_157286 [Serpula lacrymans var. lacrymans S7.3]|uniref:Uncharacterized protein n=1 Tax=Serpula lacrymans var. lacrymans (strain S7.3) TaxID=936435 RepID=F8QIB6_SERL3|nr:hypothetical protein SERLA73DRAFT_157286 [Serpula lacrymans var. lacrymans S7.3]